MDSRGFPQVFNLKQLHWNNIKWICTFSFNFNINHFHAQAQNFREQIQQIKTIINQVCSFNTFSSLKPWEWQKNWISVLLLFSGFLLIKKKGKNSLYFRHFLFVSWSWCLFLPMHNTGFTEFSWGYCMFLLQLLHSLFPSSYFRLITYPNNGGQALL